MVSNDDYNVDDISRCYKSSSIQEFYFDLFSIVVRLNIYLVWK